MSRALNLTAPDIGAPDANRPEGYYLDESVSDPGTPILADNKNDIYTFFSKMMEDAGISFNNVVDQNNTSQFYQALLTVVKPITESIIASSQTFNPSVGNNYNISSDTSGGSHTITISAGVFNGQKINITSDGTGVTYVKGSGIYDGSLALGTPISDGLTLRLEWNSNLSKWIYVNEITADFVSGGINVKQYSGGVIKTSFKDTDTTDTSVGSGWYSKTISATIPIAMISYKSRSISGSRDVDSVTPTLARANRTNDWISTLVYGLLMSVGTAITCSAFFDLTGEY